MHVFDKRLPWTSLPYNNCRQEKLACLLYAFRELEPGILGTLRIIRGNPVSEVNNHLLNSDGSDLLRQWLARFIVDFRLRSRGFRENDETRTLHEIHRTTEAFMEGQRAYIGAWLSAYLCSSLEEYESMKRELLNVDNYPRWVATTLNPFVAGEDSTHFYDEYAAANMRLYEAPPGRQFICSDMPSTTLALGEEYPDFLFFDISVDKRVLCGNLRDAQSWDIVQESYTDDDVDRANLLECPSICLFSVNG